MTLDYRKEAEEIVRWSVPEDVSEKHVELATQKIVSLCQRVADEKVEECAEIADGCYENGIEFHAKEEILKLKSSYCEGEGK